MGGQAGRASLAKHDDGTLFVADARLDNRAELGAVLGISPIELARVQDATLVLRVYQRLGDAGLAQCLGAFSFALWDLGARRLTLGRDCLGNRAMFFFRGHGFVAFATTIGILLALPGVPREIDELTLANFLAVNLIETRRTFYRGIERVPSRMLVTVDGDTIKHRYYWSPDLDAPTLHRREADYVERARELFNQAVATATSDLSDVAISASGGLDSSAVAATVALLGRAETVTCFTVVPPAGTRIDVGRSKYLDEREKMDALARMHPSLRLKFFAPEGTHPHEDDITRFFARSNLPVLGPSVFGPHSFLYDAVSAAGYRSLLVGNLGNFGLSWAGRFSLLALLGDGDWRGFKRDIDALSGRSGRGLLRVLSSEVFLPAAPAWLYPLIARLRGRDPDSVERFSMLNAEFAAECDLARRWKSEGFDPWFGLHGRDPAAWRARYMFDHNQLARDFKGMNNELRGYEIRDPHADRRLLEFLLKVPERLFRQNGVPRSFARAVLADRLPPEILHEHRTGANVPEWFGRLSSRRQDTAVEIDRLDASPLARRLMDLPRLRRLLETWPTDQDEAEKSRAEYRLALNRAVHVGQFIRWVEGSNG